MPSTHSSFPVYAALRPTRRNGSWLVITKLTARGKWEVFCSCPLEAAADRIVTTMGGSP